MSLKCFYLVPNIVMCNGIYCLLFTNWISMSEFCTTVSNIDSASIYLIFRCCFGILVFWVVCFSSYVLFVQWCQCLWITKIFALLYVRVNKTSLIRHLLLHLFAMGNDFSSFFVFLLNLELFQQCCIFLFYIVLTAHRLPLYNWPYA